MVGPLGGRVYAGLGVQCGGEIQRTVGGTRRGARWPICQRDWKAHRGGGRESQPLDRTARSGRLRGPRDGLCAGWDAGATGGIRSGPDGEPGRRAALGLARAGWQAPARRNSLRSSGVRAVAPLSGPSRSRERGHGRQGDRQTLRPRPERAIPRFPGLRRRSAGSGGLRGRRRRFAGRLDDAPHGPAFRPLADCNRRVGDSRHRLLPVLQGLQGRLPGRAQVGRDERPRGHVGHSRRTARIRGQGGWFWVS